MPIPIRRALDPITPFAFNGYSDFRLPRGFAHQMAYLQFGGTVTQTGGTSVAVRARGVPVRQVQLITDNGVIPHVIRGRDAVIEAEMYDQTPLANIYTPPSGVTTATPFAFSGVLPLFFSEPFAGQMAWRYTALPSWAYTGEAILRVYWGDQTEIYSATAYGTGVLTNPTCKLMLISADRWSADEATASDFTSRFQPTYKSFTETPTTGGGRVAIDVPRTEPVRSIVIVTEDSSGNPTDNILGTVTLEEDTSVQRVSGVPAALLATETARIFGAARSTGVYVIEFADDQDVSEINPANRLSSFQLKADTNGVGTIRVYTRRIAPPKF